MSKEIIHLRRWTVIAGMCAALMIGALLGGAGAGMTGRALGETHSSLAAVGLPDSSSHAAVRDPAAVASRVNFLEGFSPVVKAALPAVVNVNSSKVVRTNGSPFGGDDSIFRRFFGDQFGGSQGPRTQKERAAGSGVIITPDGYILTNNHMVEQSTEVNVTLNDKRQFRAKVIGTDPRTDLALLKINSTGLPTLPLGDSSKMEVGDFVLAIGEPFGLGGSVSMGIVSATGRANLAVSEGGYGDYIQTDAAINPGNSGGALVDVHGELVGINTFIMTQSGGSEGIGFAIPINMARPIMDQIREHGKVVRGYLGVGIQDITPELASAFHLSKAEGVLVGDVTPGGPGDHAGLKKGDVIVKLNGEAATDMNRLRLNIASMSPGSSVRLTIVRDGREQDVSVKLGELPEKIAEGDNDQNDQGEGMNSSQRGVFRGMQVQNLTSEIAGQLRLPENTRGVVVTRVAQDSAASEAGLRRGDVIQEVNRHGVSSVSEYQSAVEQAGKGTALLLVNRGGQTLFLTLKNE